MKKYFTLEKELIEKLEQFEDRINQKNGDRLINISRTDSGYAVLMERIS